MQRIHSSHAQINSTTMIGRTHANQRNDRRHCWWGYSSRSASVIALRILTVITASMTINIPPPVKRIVAAISWTSPTPWGCSSGKLATNDRNRVARQPIIREKMFRHLHQPSSVIHATVLNRKNIITAPAYIITVLTSPPAASVYYTTLRLAVNTYWEYWLRVYFSFCYGKTCLYNLQQTVKHLLPTHWAFNICVQYMHLRLFNFPICISSLLLLLITLNILLHFIFILAT